MGKLLEVTDLKAGFRIDGEQFLALRGISFELSKGETLCIVGESGCGKSVTSLAIMDLLPVNGNVVGGSIKFKGQELLTLSTKERRSFRGNKIGMIFQEPMTALNPLLTIGYQLKEALKLHKCIKGKEASQKAIEYLEKVGIPEAKERLKQYPYQLSGGLRQRVMIAMVLCAEPDIIIADEPTTALDVTIQAQVLKLLEDLKKELNIGIILITHDMGVVAEVADRVCVLYAGEKCEEGTSYEIFNNPKHPYTKGLLASVPNIDSDSFNNNPIPGVFPTIQEEIDGCRFNTRCTKAFDKCFSRKNVLPIVQCAKDHYFICHLGAETNETK
ncbi:ABC transporter ATP-binding protein [Clostridium sp. DL1XJH146]